MNEGRLGMNNNYPFPPLCLGVQKLHDRLLAKGCYDLDAELTFFQICRHLLVRWDCFTAGGESEEKERAEGKCNVSHSWLLNCICVALKCEEEQTGSFGIMDWIDEENRKEWRDIGWQRDNAPVWSIRPLPDAGLGCKAWWSD